MSGKPMFVRGDAGASVRTAFHLLRSGVPLFVVAGALQAFGFRVHV